jgi:hypothetical protein
VAEKFIAGGNQRTRIKTTDLSQVTDKLYHIMLYTSPLSRFDLTTYVVIGTDCIGSCKSNNHTITTTTTLKGLSFSVVLYTLLWTTQYISNIMIQLMAYSFIQKHLSSVDISSFELSPLSFNPQIFCRVKQKTIKMAEHVASWSRNKDWLARKQDNISKWNYMSTQGLLFQCGSTIKIQ